jgi:phosphoesterase RecJ-like protein
MKNEKILKAISYIENAKTIALVCHVSPDGDTVGSVLAFSVVLKKLGKEIGIFCYDMPPQKFSFLQNYQLFNKSTEKKFDLAVAVDCSDASRTGICGMYFKHAKATLAIDHHKTNQLSTDYLLCEVSAAATAELMFDVIKQLEIKSGKELMDDKVAESLFVAIVTDSGAFGFSNVTSNTHRVASELYKYKFDASEIIYKFMRSRSFKVFNLQNRVLQDAKFFFDNQLAIINFKKSDFEATDTLSSDTEGIINNLINIQEVKIAVAMTEEYDKYYKISIRTKEPIDASDCVSSFGGGGHARAAGCRINGFYEDVIDKLLKVAGDRL